MRCPICNTELKENHKSHTIYCPACNWFDDDWLSEDDFEN